MLICFAPLRSKGKQGTQQDIWEDFWPPRDRLAEPQTRRRGAILNVKARMSSGPYLPADYRQRGAGPGSNASRAHKRQRVDLALERH